MGGEWPCRRSAKAGGWHQGWRTNASITAIVTFGRKAALLAVQRSWRGLAVGGCPAEGRPRDRHRRRRVAGNGPAPGALPAGRDAQEPAAGRGVPRPSSHRGLRRASAGRWRLACRRGRIPRRRARAGRSDRSGRGHGPYRSGHYCLNLWVNISLKSMEAQISRRQSVPKLPEPAGPQRHLCICA